MAGSGSSSISGVVLTNMGSAIWGVPDAVDSSISVQSVSAHASAESKTYSDRLGVPFGTAQWGFKMEMDIAGIIIDPHTGIMTDSIGSIITLAAITGFGTGGLAAGGATILQDISVDYKSNDVAQMKAKATYFADIPANSIQVKIAGVGLGG